MFIFVDGIPKSGKSYYSVNYMHENIDKYSKIYTNINGMKMTDKIRPLNFDKIREIVLHCYNIFQEESSKINEDTEVIELDSVFLDYLIEIDFLKINPKYETYNEEIDRRNKLSYFAKKWINFRKPLVRETKYLRVLLVIDECYNYFEQRSSDKLLLWLISYHAHLYLDVILMSQSPEDIHRSYQNRVNYFLHAMDASRGVLNLKFRYQKHLKYPFNTNAKYGAYVGDIKIKKKKEIFDMYKAGDKGATNSSVLPYIIMAASLIIFLIILVFLIQKYAFGNDENTKNNDFTKTKITHFKKINDAVIQDKLKENMSYIKLQCIVNECSNIKNNIHLNIDDLEHLVKITDSEFLQYKKISANQAEVYLLVSGDFIQLFKGAKNEKKGFNFIN